MGFVYLAEHRTLGTMFAIKVLRPDPDTSLSLARQRFEREAQVIAGLDHENIIRVIDLDFENDYGFFVMDFLCGSTLQQRIADSSALTLEFIADMTAQICSAIGYAHQRGIIHRDLKPANIFIVENVEEKAKVKVLDFGLLKILGPQQLSGTQSGSILGTPYYMSPEQWDAREDIDSRADVYSLGVILYEMLSGRVPFEAKNILELSRMHKEEEPRPLADSGR
ncbi:MAG: serine/threonine protein kinase, partial [Pyrinomonadaceae bacterium]